LCIAPSATPPSSADTYNLKELKKLKNGKNEIIPPRGDKGLSVVGYIEESPLGCSSAEAKEPAASDRCPHQEIIDLYHELLPQLPRIREWTPDRQSMLRTRWNEKKERRSLEWWREFFETKVAPSDFLMGRVKSWQSDLEWIIRPRNFPKVLEGRYLAGDRSKGDSWAERMKLEMED